jgi:hypothetical protein
MHLLVLHELFTIPNGVNSPEDYNLFPAKFVDLTTVLLKIKFFWDAAR